MKTSLNLALYIFVLLVSIVIILYISLQLFNKINIRYFSNTTQGQITGYHTKKSQARFGSNKKQVYAPVFSFTDTDNKEIEVITDNFSETMKYKKGDNVTVYYNPKNSEKAHISDSFSWKNNLMLLGVGIICFYFGIVPLLKHFK